MQAELQQMRRALATSPVAGTSQYAGPEADTSPLHLPSRGRTHAAAPAATPIARQGSSESEQQDSAELELRAEVARKLASMRTAVHAHNRDAALMSAKRGGLAAKDAVTGAAAASPAAVDTSTTSDQSDRGSAVKRKAAQGKGAAHATHAHASQRTAPRKQAGGSQRRAKALDQRARIHTPLSGLPSSKRQKPMEGHRRAASRTPTREANKLQSALHSARARHGDDASQNEVDAIWDLVGRRIKQNDVVPAYAAVPRVKSQRGVAKGARACSPRSQQAGERAQRLSVSHSSGAFAAVKVWH